MTVDLQPGSDSGISDSDELTNDSTPTLGVTVNELESRGLIEVDFNGDEVVDSSLPITAPGLWITRVEPTGGSGHRFDKLELVFSQPLQDGQRIFIVGYPKLTCNYSQYTNIKD